MAVLSIQSSVAFGHVGNAAAVLPLQRLGVEVWPVNTVQFSNHPGYGEHRGRIHDPAEVADLIAGVGARGAFARCRAVLSGYLGAPGTGPVVMEAVAAVKAANPAALYCCDPAMGDRAEGLYVAEPLAAFVRDTLVAHADIVVPNAFELAYLTGRPVESTADALAAADGLLARGPGLVAVTSLAGAANDPPTIATLAATRSEAWLATTPRLDLAAKGTGDAFAALFLGRRLLGDGVRAALEGAVAAVFALVEATVAAEARELRLVAAQDAVVAPRTRFSAERLR